MTTVPRVRPATVLRPLLLAAALAAAALPALAEEVEMESLGAEAAKPRVAAHSASFEMVAIAHDRGLAVFLDSAAENTPVQGATLWLAVGAKRVPMREEVAGVYAPVGWTPGPGSHPLQLSVSAGAVSEELSATLVVPGTPGMSGAASRIAAAGSKVRAVLTSPAALTAGGLTVALAAGVAFGRRRAAALRQVRAEG